MNSIAQKQHSGFTLVELVCALALLGILAVAAAPILGTAGDSVAMDSATKRIEADLRYAQNMATTTGDKYGFEASSNTAYSIYKTIGGVRTTATSPYNHQPMNINMATSFPNVTFTAATYPAYTIEFDVTGKPTLGGGTTITLVVPSGETSTAIVTATSGNITGQ